MSEIGSGGERGTTQPGGVGAVDSRGNQASVRRQNRTSISITGTSMGTPTTVASAGRDAEEHPEREVSLEEADATGRYGPGRIVCHEKVLGGDRLTVTEDVVGVFMMKSDRGCVASGFAHCPTSEAIFPSRRLITRFARAAMSGS